MSLFVSYVQVSTKLSVKKCPFCIVCSGKYINLRREVKPVAARVGDAVSDLLDKPDAAPTPAAAGRARAAAPAAAPPAAGLPEPRFFTDRINRRKLAYNYSKSDQNSADFSLCQDFSGLQQMWI